MEKSSPPVPLVREIHLDSVTDFVDVFSPTPGLFLGASIFRGQGDAEWGLTPPYFRLAREGQIPYLTASSTYEDLVRREARIIMNYVETLGAYGPQPSWDFDKVYHQCHKYSIYGPDDVDYWEWPVPQVVPALIHARQHGAPTRLLEWTTKPLVAAYIAASSCLTLRSEPKCMAIWVANKFGLTGYAPVCTIELEPKPRSPIEFSKSREAKVMVFRPLKDQQIGVNVPGLESIVAWGGEATVRRIWSYVKIILPRALAPSLLRLLDGFDVNGATVFPGQFGVAKLVAEAEFHALHDDPAWVAYRENREERIKTLQKRLDFEFIKFP